MTKFRALLWLNLKGMLTSFRMGRKRTAGVGALALMAGLALYLSGLYSYLFAQQLAPTGQFSLLFLLMPVLALGFGVLYTVFAVQGIVFGGKDNDLMLSLPVSPFSLALARVAALYLENLVFSLFVMLPAGIVYLYFGGPGGAGFALRLLVATPFLAILPTQLSLLMGFILSLLSSKLRRKALLSNLLYGLFLVLVFIGVLQMNRLVTELALQAGAVAAAFQGWGAPLRLFQQGTSGGQWPALAGFCVLCILPFLAVVWLLGRYYQKIVTNLTTHRTRSDYRLGQLSGSGPLRALMKKEARKYFSTPLYLFNTGLGLLLLVGGGVFALVRREALTAVLYQLEAVGERPPILPLLALGLGFLLATVAVTACSISLEGKYLWILKEAPVSAEIIFGAKVSFQMLLSAPCLLVGITCLALTFSLSVVQWGLLLLLGFSFGGLIAFWGLWLNLCLPRLDAHSEAYVIKQSASAMLAVFSNLLFVGVGALSYFLFHGALGQEGALLAVALLCLVGSLGLKVLLQTAGRRKLEIL